MKLWRTLKTVGGHRTGNEHKTSVSSLTSSNQTADTYEMEDINHRRSSESPDSGLAGERLAVRTTVHLDRRRGAGLGLILAGRSEPGLLPTISGFKKDSPNQDVDKFAPGDKICSINGIATARLTNDEVLAMLENVEERASLEVEYYLPNYDSQTSLCITSRIAVVSVERDGEGHNSSLGITLRCSGGGGAAMTCGGSTPSLLLITHVRPNGPAHRTHRIKAGDRLLKVDNISLSNKSLSDAYQILQTCPLVTNLTIEYDVSIMESVKFATGPLLIEIERGCNEHLGLILTDKNYNEDCFGTGANYQSVDGNPGIFIESIVPASISDRCGALHPGDQILTVDDLLVDNGQYTPEEVMCYMETCSGKGFTQMQILPVHMLLKNHRLNKNGNPNSPVFGMSTINSRKSTRQKQQFRQSSLPKSFETDSDYVHNNFVSGVGVCRSEILSIHLEVPPGHDSGITVCEDRELLLVSHITHQSPAYRSGCIQLGDRIIAINSQQNLTTHAANDILQKLNDTNCTKYLNIKSEFSMADSVEASSGIFNVKLAKNGAGLGITITGNKQRGMGANEPMIISHIKIGSVAYRSGTLAVGDHLIAIDSQPLQNLSLDAAFNILQNFPDDIITLTIKKTNKENGWSDVRNNKTKYPYGTSESPSSASVKSNCTYAQILPHNKLAISDDNTLRANQLDRDHSEEMGVENIFDVELNKQDEGPLGLTIAGSEDATQPIILSGLIKGGLAEQTGLLQIGDHILSINEQSVLQKPLSEAISMLQNSSPRIVFKIARRSNSVATKITVPVQIENCESFSNRDSNTFTNNSQSSPGLASVDSAVESWDSQAIGTRDKDNTLKEYNSEEKDICCDNRISYLPEDEEKIIISGHRPQDQNINNHDLPLPNYSFTNTLRTFRNDGRNVFQLNDNVYDSHNMFGIQYSNTSGECSSNKNNHYKTDLTTFATLKTNNCRKTNDNGSESSYGNNNSSFSNSTEIHAKSNDRNPLNIGNFQLPSTSFQLPMYESEFSGLHNTDLVTNQGTIHHVTLYKDVIYDDYGFSVSDGLYERGVYINRIRKGGPADIVGLLKPYDRILQVNGTRTVDFDCCLTVPLIASAGDRIELVLQRLKDSWSDDNNSNSIEGNVVTKTI